MKKLKEDSKLKEYQEALEDETKGSVARSKAIRSLAGFSKYQDEERAALGEMRQAEENFYQVITKILKVRWDCFCVSLTKYRI
jgi:hypothetical protein